MRILTLDLDRFGPFTGKRLAFRPDARLHVVLGPNEAGKSSALAAVTDLLFGIEERTPYNFLHRDGLRLGAEIVDRAGERLEFWRRKGRKKVLSGPGDAALADDALTPFLGGISRGVFCNAFGLNAASLRNGAAEMLKADGEIGATLLAAASGLRGFRDAARGLEAEADELFKPRGQKQVLNQLLSRHETASQEARGAKIGATQWKTLLADEEAAAERLAGVSERKRAVASEASRLRRLRAAAPVLAALDALAAELDGFAGLPEADDATVAALAAACRLARETEDRRAEAVGALAEAERSLSAIRLDPAIEPQSAAVDGLVEGLTDYRRSEAQLPRVEREAEDESRALDAIAARLGLPDWDTAETLRPSDMATATLRALAVAGREGERERDRLARELVRLAAERDLHGAALAAHGPLVDPGPARETWDLLAPVLAEIGARDALEAAIGQEAEALTAECSRLRPPVGPAGSLPGLAIPGSGPIGRAARALDAASAEIRRCREATEAARAALAEADRRMAAQAGEAVPADPAALAEARRTRDAAWEAVRDAAFGQPGAPEGAALAERATTFERANAGADDLADRLAGDAHRAAARGQEARQRAERADALAAAERDGEAASLAAREAEAAWQALWRPLGFEPLPPAEMSAWRETALDLVRSAEIQAGRRRDRAAISARIEAIRPPLAALAGRLGLGGLDAVPVGLVGQRVADRVRSLGRAWDDARDAMARRDAAADALAAAGRAAEDNAAARAAWAERWRDALAAAALPPASGLDAAEAALAAWADVPGPLAARASLRARGAGMRRDRAEYESRVGRVAAALDAGTERDLVDTVRNLQERSVAARDARTLWRAREEARASAGRIAEKAGASADSARLRLAEIAGTLGVAAEADLGALAGRLEARAGLRSRERDLRDALARLGEGVPEAILRAEAAETTPDIAEARLAELATEGERLDGEDREAFLALTRLRDGRAVLEGGTGAEKAAARRGAAELAIRETARRWVVLRLGSLLLDAATDRHRAGQQDPLVRRAGDLFGILTGGAYAGIEQAYDDQDRIVVSGRRSSGGGTVALDHLSEGTKDQLYLGLRLAYLEDYARRAEPAPFLGDDIFASFDDARTVHGLQALAAIGRDVQPILFTHHESVARAAETALGPDVDIVPLA